MTASDPTIHPTTEEATMTDKAPQGHTTKMVARSLKDQGVANKATKSDKRSVL